MSELLPVAAPSREVVVAALGAKNPRGIKTPLDLLARVEEESPEAARALQREVAFPPCFVVNEVRNVGDVAIAHKLVVACSGQLAVRASHAGYIHHDDRVWQAVRRCRVFMSDAPTSPASQQVRQVTRALVKGEGLGPGY